jgi:uncharacterized membrane protein
MKRFLLSRQSLYWVAAGALLGGILHILVVLTTPGTASDTAMRHLLDVAPVNAALALPAVTPETQVFAYMAPDVRYAVCRYDISKDPLSVRTPLLDPTWSIALYDDLGENFYTITGADLQRREAELVLAPSEDGATAIPFGNDAPTTAITVSVPKRQGLVVIRAPVRLSALHAEIDRALSQVRCEPKPGQRAG